MELHERLRYAREYLNISQENMADIVGMSQTAISQMENGTRKKANMKYVDELVMNQGVNYEWIIRGTGSMMKNESNKTKVNEKSNNEQNSDDKKVINLLEKILKKEEENGKLMKQLLDSFPKTLSIIENLTSGNMSVNLGKAKAYDRRQLLSIPIYGTGNTAYARP